MRGGLLIAFTLVLLPGLARTQTACLTSLPPNPPFIPPAPYDAVTVPDGTFWYGSSPLWTRLDATGVWHTEHNVDQHGGYVDKLIFWSRQFDWRKEHNPQLIVTARRLDGDSPSVAVAGANAVFITGNTPAMMTGIRIPTAGCWQLTAYYSGHSLDFVVLIER